MLQQARTGREKFPRVGDWDECPEIFPVAILMLACACRSPVGTQEIEGTGFLCPSNFFFKEQACRPHPRKKKARGQGHQGRVRSWSPRRSDDAVNGRRGFLRPHVPR
uniref:Uncharacterized protein n=1 Tax=Arundo donax TaxID=35708 RepID=A0A0A8XNX8_ARUDO